MTTNPLKSQGYQFTCSDKMNCHTCKNLTKCEDIVSGTTIKVDRYHVCDKIDVKAQYKK